MKKLKQLFLLFWFIPYTATREISSSSKNNINAPSYDYDNFTVTFPGKTLFELKKKHFLWKSLQSHPPIKVDGYYSIHCLPFVNVLTFWYIVKGQKQPKYILLINKKAFIHIRIIVKKFIYYKWFFQGFATF